MSVVLNEIRSRGYWDAAILPEPYDESRLDYGDLKGSLTNVTVHLRGWPVPFIDYSEALLHGPNWIGQDIDASIVAHYEAWRFFTSGQFSQLRSVSADWREGGEATRVPEGASSFIEVWEILYYLTELFELAARMALGPVGGDRFTIRTELNGLLDRALVFGHPRYVPFMRPHKSSMPTMRHEVTLSRDDLVAATREHAARMAREFFLRFGWNPELAQVLRLQQELESL